MFVTSYDYVRFVFFPNTYVTQQRLLNISRLKVEHNRDSSVFVFVTTRSDSKSVNVTKESVVPTRPSTTLCMSTKQFPTAKQSRFGRAERPRIGERVHVDTRDLPIVSATVFIRR